MRIMYFSVMAQANLEKEIPSAPIRSRIYDLPITSSDALPLSLTGDSWELRPLN